MNDSQDTQDKNGKACSKRSCCRFILPVILIILLIAGVGYFVTTQMGLDKKLVEEAVNQWGQRLHDVAATEGQDITFAYDAVEMDGGATSRHAIIKNPRLLVKAKHQNQPQPVLMVFKTESALLYPQSVTFDAIRVKLDKPILIDAEGQPVGRVTASEPIEVNGSRKMEQGVSYTHSTMNIPAKIDILSLTTNETVVVTLDPGAKIEGSSAGVRGLGSFGVVLSKLQVMDPANKPVLSVKSLNLEGVSRKLAETAPVATDKVAINEDRFDVTLRGHADEVMGEPEDMPYGALSMVIDAQYTGPLPKEDETVDWSVMDSHLLIKDLTVKSADTALQTSADFRTGTGDLLPVGEANIKLNNFPFVRDELRKHQMLPEAYEDIVDALLRGMVGTGIQDTKQVDVKLSRAKGGSLQLGNMTFEEAMAIVITGGKMGAKDPLFAPAPTTLAPAAGGAVQPQAPAMPAEAPQPSVTQ